LPHHNHPTDHHDYVDQSTADNDHHDPATDDHVVYDQSEP
jgi:hypothetical protein